LELEARRRSPARRAPPRQGQVRRLYMQTHRNTLQRTARCNAAVQSHIKEGLLLKKAELDEEYVHTKKYMYREIYIRTLCNILCHSATQHCSREIHTRSLARNVSTRKDQMRNVHAEKFLNTGFFSYEHVSFEISFIHTPHSHEYNSIFQPYTPMPGGGGKANVGLFSHRPFSF